MLVKDGKEYYPIDFGTMIKNGKTYYSRSAREKPYFYLVLRTETDSAETQQTPTE